MNPTIKRANPPPPPPGTWSLSGEPPPNAIGLVLGGFCWENLATLAMVANIWTQIWSQSKVWTHCRQNHWRSQITRSLCKHWSCHSLGLTDFNTPNIINETVYTAQWISFTLGLLCVGYYEEIYKCVELNKLMLNKMLYVKKNWY